MNRLPKILFAVLLTMMFLPMIQQCTSWIKVEPLEGAYNLNPKPELSKFTWGSWLEENFQATITKSVEDNIGFREPLVRLHNQVDFSLFNHSNSYAVVGKNNCLYEESYILDYCGLNFTGDDYIRKKLKRAKRVQDYLKAKHNIDMIIVYEPGKASFYPEDIPYRYLRLKSENTNYKSYSRISKELNISHIDLNAWFVSQKNKLKHPLFKEFGIHWSNYGTYLGLDSVLHYMEKIHSIKMPDMVWDSIVYTDQITDGEHDIENTLNLIFPLHKGTEMAYPKVHYDSKNKTKPNVLVIGDSYSWGFYHQDIAPNVWNKNELWYYNQTLFPYMWGNDAKLINHEHMEDTIKQYDYILIMVTELNLHKAFFDFTDQLYDIYFPNEKDAVYDMKRRIRAEDGFSTELFKQMVANPKNSSLIFDRMARERVKAEALQNKKQ
jgi:hypothetical protein